MWNSVTIRRLVTIDGLVLQMPQSILLYLVSLHVLLCIQRLANLQICWYGWVASHARRGNNCVCLHLSASYLHSILSSLINWLLSSFLQPTTANCIRSFFTTLIFLYRKGNVIFQLTNVQVPSPPYNCSELACDM